MGRTALVGVIVLTGALALAGCATGTPIPDAQPPPEQVVEYEAAAPARPLMTTEDYLITIRGLLSGREHFSQSDAEYIQGGKDICSDFADGATWRSYSREIAAAGGDLAFYRAAVRAAVYTFCPERIDAL